MPSDTFNIIYTFVTFYIQVHFTFDIKVRYTRICSIQVEDKFHIFMYLTAVCFQLMCACFWKIYGLNEINVKT